jgi:DNA-binding helix-hairpin-helix protein with protein kinase domain
VTSRSELVTLSDGRTLELGNQLGKGGEGTVFELKGASDFVAKLYNGPIPTEKAAKLSAMTSLGTPQLLNVAAWPLATIASSQGSVRGFVMPRLVGYRPLHDLYNPASRKQNFPKADFKYLVHASRNLAAAAASIHDLGCVIGDVNQGNAYVHTTNATIRLIDCDSFQIASGRFKWLCEVGVAHFTPPELQSVSSFKSQERTANHDAFGLAVLIFHLLMFGRHPYAGIYQGHDHIELEQAIKQHWFTFGSNASRLQIRPPPGTAPIKILGPDVAGAFEQAFQSNAALRPSARTWVKCLDQLEKNLKRCEEDGAHVYPNHLSQCPWCEIEEKSGTLLFVSRVQAPTNLSSRFNISVVWSKIEGIRLISPPAPKSPAELPSPPAQIDAGFAMARSMVPIIRGIGMFLGVALIAAKPELWVLGAIIAGVAWVWSNNIGPSFAPLIDARKRAAEQHQRAVEEWSLRTAGTNFRMIRTDLEKLKAQYDKVPMLYCSAMEDLKRQARDHQLKHFLQGFFLHGYKIKGIGDARLLTLQSFGISTAADITSANLSRVPGFGSKLTDALYAWRESKATRFVFNPNQALDPSDTAAVFRKYDHMRRELEHKLQVGADLLASAALEHEKTLRLLGPRVEAAAAALRQADVNLTAAQR